MPDNWPDMFRSDDPVTQLPQWQRRVISVQRPIVFVENMHEVMLECGHEPLVFADQTPAAGSLLFCPDCYEEGK